VKSNSIHITELFGLVVHIPEDVKSIRYISLIDFE
jgi:hypothetical protein